MCVMLPCRYTRSLLIICSTTDIAHTAWTESLKLRNQFIHIYQSATTILACKPIMYLCSGIQRIWRTGVVDTICRSFSSFARFLFSCFRPDGMFTIQAFPTAKLRAAAFVPGSAVQLQITMLCVGKTFLEGKTVHNWKTWFDNEAPQNDNVADYLSIRRVSLHRPCHEVLLMFQTIPIHRPLARFAVPTKVKDEMPTVKTCETHNNNMCYVIHTSTCALQASLCSGLNNPKDSTHALLLMMVMSVKNSRIDYVAVRALLTNITRILGQN